MATNRSLFTITFSSSGDSSSEEAPVEPLKPKPPDRIKPVVRRVSPRSPPPPPEPSPPEEEEEAHANDVAVESEKVAKVESSEHLKVEVSEEPPAAEKVTYQVIRTMSRGLKGKRVHFQLVEDSQPLLHTKIKGDSAETMYVAKGTDMHFSGSEFEGVILATANMTSYAVRKGSLYGDEYATIRFSTRQGADKGRLPRIMRANIMERPAWLDGPKLVSRAPTRGPLGTWTLDFGERAVVPSIKNAILVDSNNKEVCAIMKIDEGSLTITTCKGLDPLIVFAMGVSSFLCKLP